VTAVIRSRVERDHWVLERLGEIAVVALVWVTVVVLRVLARGADRVEYELVGTTVNLAILGAVMAGMVMATGWLAPNSSRRIVPAVAALMGIGFLLVSLVVGPLRSWDVKASPTGERELLAHFGIGVLLYTVVLIVVGGRLQSLTARIPAFTRRPWRATVALIGLGVLGLFALVFLTAAGRNATTIDLPVLPEVQPGDLIRIMAVGAGAIALSHLGLRLRLDAERPGGVLPFLRLPAPKAACWAVGVPIIGVVFFGVVGDLGPAIILAFGTAFLVWFATDHARYLVATLLVLLGVAVAVAALPISLGAPSDRFKAWLDFDPPQQLAVAPGEPCPENPPPIPLPIPTDVDPINCDFGKANGQVARSKMLVALGSLGGVGVGSGRGYQIEARQDDSAMAVLGESVGLLGVSIALMALMVFCLEAVGAGYRAGGAAGLFVAGIGMLYCVQGVLIAAGILGYLPLTGVTYPLVSVGGASTVTFLGATAVVVFVSGRQRAFDIPRSPGESALQRGS
jgi:cell division protein FtsW (lipid II flippase)